MKKIFSLVLVAGLILAWSPASFATAVTANRANDNNDLTVGAAFDNVGAWTLTVTDGANFTNGVVTTAGNGGANAGTVTFAGTSTINTANSANVLGAAGAGLLAVNAGVAGATVTTTGNVVATQTNLTGTGTLALGGNLTGILNYNNGATGTVTLASGKTITGAVNNATTGQGTLTLGSGSATTSTVGNTGNGLAAINVSGGNATIGGNTKAVGFSVGTNTLAITGTVATPATGTIATTATSGTAFGKITSTGIATITAGTAVTVTVSGYVANGSSMTIVDGTGGAAVGAATITSTSPSVTFTQGASTSDLVLTATRNVVATGSNGSTVNTVINGVTSPTSDMTTVLGALDGLTSTAAVDAAVNQLDPIVNAGANAASFTAMNESIGALNEHLSEVNSAGAGKKGTATGDFWKEEAVWIKGFGTHSDQGTRSGVDGYKANLWGITGGMDGMVAENTRLGFSGGYASTAVTNKGAQSGGTDIDSVQGTVYLSFDDPSPWYGNAGFSFAWNMYSETRNIAFGSINRTAKGDPDGQQYTGFGDIGYVWKNMDIEKGQEWDITPMAGLTYSHLDIDSYTESGADALNLAVNSQNYDLLQSSLGVKVERPWTDSSGNKFVPEIHCKWLYDFIGDKAATNATFTGGGSSFSTRGAAPAQNSLNAGAGLTFYTKGNLSITGTYELEAKSSYISHTGLGILRYEF